MAAVLKMKEFSIPAVYYREYKNDLPKKGEVANPLLGQCLRVTQVALPFIALYKPLSQPLSIVLGSTRVISSVSQMINAISSGDSLAIGRTALEVAIAVTALTCSIFAHPLGMLVTTAHDMIMNVAQLVQAIQDKDYVKAAEIGMHLMNNALYWGCFFTGSLEWSIASIGMQIFLGLYNSCDEFKKGNYLEGCGHFLMAGIRGKQMHDQIKVLQVQKTFEKILADAIAQQEKTVFEPKNVILTAASGKQAMLACAKAQDVQQTSEYPSLNNITELDAFEIDAGKENSQELADVLIKYSRNKYGWSALNYAINCEDYDAAIMLIKNGADCFKSDKNHYHSYSPIERLFMNTCNSTKPADLVQLCWRLKPFHETKQASAKQLTSILLKEYVTHKGQVNCFSHAQDILKGLIVNKWPDQLKYIFESKYYLGFLHVIQWANLYNWLVGRKDLKTISELDKHSSQSELIERKITLENRLAMAIGHNSLEMVKYFVECGASVKGSLSTAIKVQQENKTIIQFLISQGATL